MDTDLNYDLLEVRSHFWVFCFFLVDCFALMESINVAGVLQKAEDADSRACTKSQV